MPLYKVVNSKGEILYTGSITDCTIFKKSMKDDSLTVKQHSFK